MIRWEVQHHTFFDGWVNTWTEIDPEGNETPSTFDTYNNAKIELDEFFADIQDEIDRGERQPDEGYDRDEYQIVAFDGDRMLTEEETKFLLYHELATRLPFTQGSNTMTPTDRLAILIRSILTRNDMGPIKHEKDNTSNLVITTDEGTFKIIIIRAD